MRKILKAGAAALAMAGVVNVPCASEAMTSVADSEQWGTEGIRSTSSAGYITRAELMLNAGNARGALDQLELLPRVQLSAGEREKALLMRCMALMQCDDAGCVECASELIRLCPGSAMAEQARCVQADFYFFREEYERALQVYIDVKTQALTPEDADEVRYRTAYCTLKLADYREATQLFEEIVGSRVYGEAARYYLAYISYVEGDLETARKGFERYALKGVASNAVKGMPQAPDASCYMAQIDFAQGRYGDVVRATPSLLKNSFDPAMTRELQRISGESYFNLGQQEAAEPYLERYMREAGNDAQPSARYMLGVIRYEQKDYKEAERLFEPVASLSNELGQSASLYLGQCELQLGEAGAATVAFERAYRMSYSPAVTETAMYNYAAMLTDGQAVPFGQSSIDLLERFVQQYPQSELASEADEYLATAYFKDRNYSRALESINRITHPSAAVLQAKQKILYELGVENISNGGSAEAVKYLQEAADMRECDGHLATRSTLWLADAQYNIGDYAAATRNYEKYLQEAPRGDVNIPLANYNLGYALYMQNKFGEALPYYRKALANPGTLISSMQADAMTRIADCQYYSGQHSEALHTYERAMQIDEKSSDYAALQHANMLGRLGRNAEKIEALDRMMASYPGSALLPQALLEKAQTYMQMGAEDKAISEYSRLTETYPQSPETREGLLQLAIAYGNAGKTDKAIGYYKRVIERWPTSEQAQVANEDLRNIYAGRGELENYAQYLRGIPGAPSIDESEIDKLTFEAAENAMLENADDTDMMLRYINNFPEGKYLDRALYSVAGSRYAAGKYAEALGMLEALSNKRPDSGMMPEATLLRARIYEDTDLGSRRDAATAWRELLQCGGTAYHTEACAGVMRNTDSPTERVEYANLLTHTSGLTTEQMEEAYFYRALGELSQQQYAAAENDLKKLIGNPKSLYGSRGTVELAEYYIGRMRYDEARTLLESFTESGTPHQYWLARGFISLADVYKAQGKGTLARQYMQSLKENYPGSEADIWQMIEKRLK